MAGAAVLNMFHVENFMCFIKLRAGTLFSLYLIFILSLLGILCSVATLGPYNTLLLFVSIANLLVSGFTLIYFPGMDKKYENNSMNTNCIKYFSIFNGVMMVFGFFPIVGIVLNTRKPFYFDTFMTFAFFTFIWTVVFAHLAAVSYSFYLSILQPKNEHQSDSVTNNVVNKTSGKNINFNVSSGRKNDTKIDIPPQPIDPSANGSGNLYVELR